VGESVLGLRERKKQRTRATLIDAAVELCNRQGFERTTVDQIAAIADVSPRTFSRYFATKDAVVLALIDDVADIVAVELARQPADISDLEALCRAHADAFTRTTAAPATGMSAERLLAAARIINSSPALKHAATDFRLDAVNAALANRMGVSARDPQLKLVAAVWSAIVMTALGDLDASSDWDQITVDTIVARLTSTFAQFVDVMSGIGQPA
jgi:AcrR family transcriptional regulator